MTRLHPAHPDFKRGFIKNAGVVFDPGTAMMASTAVSALGSIQSGNAQSDSYKSQAAADSYNATINLQNADQAGKEGTQKELAYRTSTAKQMGEIRASIGQAGIGGAGGGTASLALEEDSVNAELDALGIRYETDTTRNSYIDQSNLDTFSASVAKKNASAAKTAGYIGAASAILGGANKFYANQQKLSNLGFPAANNGTAPNSAKVDTSFNVGTYMSTPRQRGVI